MPAPVQIMLWIVLAIFTLDLVRREWAARRQARRRKLATDTTKRVRDGEAGEPDGEDEPDEPDEAAEPDEAGAAGETG
jgi:hypothetical protein